MTNKEEESMDPLIRGFRVRAGKSSKDICMLSSEDVANYIVEHYDSKTDEVVVKPILDDEIAPRERYLS